MRVVLDTNILFSGFRMGGKPKIALELALEETYTLVLSGEILAELKDVLSRKSGWSSEAVAVTMEQLAGIGERVEPLLILTDCPDDDDNRILEAAVAGAADCIVSGDKHLLRMNPFRGIEILAVSDFLARLGLQPLTD